MKKNVKFEYLYRDAGNYKVFDFIILSNSRGMSIAEIRRRINEVLIDETYFYPIAFQLPNIRVHKYDPDLDVDWYEFDECSETNQKHTDNRDICELLNSLSKFNKTFESIL